MTESHPTSSDCCAVCLLPSTPLSAVTDVVATLSHRAWTTNRVFPLTDSNCWPSAKQGEEGRKGKRHGLIQRERSKVLLAAC